jgi:hypothetical protein
MVGDYPSGRILIDSLKPGGTVVMECAANYVGRNGMLKMFDALQITRYERIGITASRPTYSAWSL